MQFNSSETRHIYAGRHADGDWISWSEENLSPKNKNVVDIGCGGGIYTSAFVEMGAKSVVGIDKSKQYIEDNKEEYKAANLSFSVGDALQTDLKGKCADIVFERALVHHLSKEEQDQNAMECHRILKPDGVLAVQDRTIEDVEENNPKTWIRSTLFEAFPRLIEFERDRRPSRNNYLEILEQWGFSNVTIVPFLEVRKKYQSFEPLRKEIMARKGKSILFQLSDDELNNYCELLEEKSKTNSLVECDLWTVWLAGK